MLLSPVATDLPARAGYTAVAASPPMGMHDAPHEAVSTAASVYGEYLQTFDDRLGGTARTQPAEPGMPLRCLAAASRLLSPGPSPMMMTTHPAGRVACFPWVLPRLLPRSQTSPWRWNRERRGRPEASFRRITFHDRFSAGCACGVPFVSRLDAAKHALACGRLEDTLTEAAPAAGDLIPTDDAVCANATVADQMLVLPHQDPTVLAMSPHIRAPLQTGLRCHDGALRSHEN
ncbi:hypothetical protein PsorP6_013693 [Peronosclerospora sorghi]|uniref:Uncharacterized protein n=1 Tax=Peronosclerospora sorghi TaxID=230839 RepID=A0ACC0VJW8_9STRA|nr:hypothetical protein PsorP6_013693 [Peronosclerospora sorghi]